jgi:hypothetical protein
MFAMAVAVWIVEYFELKQYTRCMQLKPTMRNSFLLHLLDLNYKL